MCELFSGLLPLVNSCMFYCCCFKFNVFGLNECHMWLMRKWYCALYFYFIYFYFLYIWFFQLFKTKIDVIKSFYFIILLFCCWFFWFCSSLYSNGICPPIIFNLLKFSSARNQLYHCSIAIINIGNINWVVEWMIGIHCTRFCASVLRRVCLSAAVVALHYQKKESCGKVLSFTSYGGQRK